MGAEFQVDSLEEMCDAMCNNMVPPKKTNWIFTFGANQKHAGHYVKFYGTYGEARKQMCEHYGEQWGFQYSEEDWEAMKNDPNRTWPMETELK